MRTLLAALLTLAWPVTAWTGPMVDLAVGRGMTAVTVPIVLTGASIQSGFKLMPLAQAALGAPALTLDKAPVALMPVVAEQPAAVKPGLTPLIRLSQNISQQTAAGGNVLSAAPELGTFFDGSAQRVFAGGVTDAYTGLSPPAPMRRLEDIKELRFGTYNVENLFRSVGKYEPDLSEPGKRDLVAQGQAKPEWQQRGVAQAILDSDLDIVSVEEVEDIQTLEEFSRKYLGGQYRALLIEGNDERGIDIGFLVKKDIPFEIEHRTNKDEMWTDPEGDGQPQKLFSRDLPVMIVRASGRAQPLFVYLGTHYKSQRPRSHNDPTSEKLRRAQVERTAEIITRLRAEFGKDVPLMLGGDFNGAVDAATFDALRQAGAGLTDALDLAEPPLSTMERVTETFHPRGQPALKSQLDAIFLSQTMRPLVDMAKVYRYKDANGKEKPIPDTWEERAKNPSDHFPVLVTIKFQPLLHP